MVITRSYLVAQVTLLAGLEKELLKEALCVLGEFDLNEAAASFGLAACI